MKVVIAPDGFGGTLTARQAAAAIADGWSSVRPDDVIVQIPLSDGGEGLLDVVTGDQDERMVTEVAGPLGHPTEAAWALRADGTAVIESALACGLALVPEPQRTPMRTSTFGVGQLIDAARAAGARRILVGLGGSATVDGGSGALIGLGYRLLTADGSGLKIGGDDLHRIARIERGWSADFDNIEVVLLADVTTTLPDSAAVFGPQKGADPTEVAVLTAALATWAQVAERDLGGGRRLRDLPGSGAAGGLGFALACALGARFEPGAEAIGEVVGFPAAASDADLIITGEGRLDATSGSGKVVGMIAQASSPSDRPVAAVVGQVGPGAPQLAAVEAASQDGPGPEPAQDVRAAAARLARSWQVR